MGTKDSRFIEFTAAAPSHFNSCQPGNYISLLMRIRNRLHVKYFVRCCYSSQGWSGAANWECLPFVNSTGDEFSRYISALVNKNTLTKVIKFTVQIWQLTLQFRPVTANNVLL